VSGNPVTGQQLTADPGTWTGWPTPALSYQWLDCDPGGSPCQAIANATGATYTVAGSDVGNTIEVQVTGTNDPGSGPVSVSAVSDPTAPVAVAPSPSPPSNSVRPTVSGASVTGQTLVASPGEWSGWPTPALTDQWLTCDAAAANCQAIAGATATSYTLAASDAGHTIAVQVTGTNTAGQTMAVSTPTAVVTVAPSPPANRSRPVLSGQAITGQTLRASPGTWSGVPAPALSYQWLACNQAGSGCHAIAHATAPSHAVTRADVGARLEALVTAANSSGRVSATSSPTAMVRAASAQIAAALRPQIAPGGSLSEIPRLLSHGGYLERLTALEAGAAQLTWYYLPRGVSMRVVAGKLVTRWVTRRHPRPVAIATARLRFTASGSRRLTIRLTAAGRRMLSGAQRLQLTGVGRFSAAGQPPVVVLQRFRLSRTAPRVLD
jgi:hypothetical protein